MIWISLALIAANVVVYAAVRRYGFVNFDDLGYVSQNPTVAAGLTWRGVVWAFTTGAAFNWHPLTWLSHMLDVQLYGMHAGSHHLTNLILHIVNALLLFGVLHRMTGALGRSGFVAALFAVHPLHVESVAWVAERKDVLSTLFWMLTLWTYVTYVRQPRRSRYALVLVCFALGLMAKPMLVTLPFVLLLLDYWPLGRVTQGGAEPPGRAGVTRASRDRRVRIQLLREKLPLFALALASSVVTFMVQRRGGAVVELDAIPLVLRVENALVSYVSYIWMMLWPTRLAVFYPYPSSLSAWRVIGAALIVIGVSATAIRVARRYPYLLVGWLWYLGTLVPVIGLVQVGSQSMADRYTYVTLIGLFVIVAWGTPELFASSAHKRRALGTAAAFVLVACVMTARVQVHYWENSVALWQRALDVTRDNYIAHDNLGNEFARLGKLDEAVVHFSEALRLKPDFPGPHNGLGYVLVAQGKVDEAIAQLREAVRLRPDYAYYHSNLAITLGDHGRIEEAIPEMLEAVRIEPNQATWHYHLAVLYKKKGETERAVRHFESSLALDPGHQAARRALNDLNAGGRR